MNKKGASVLGYGIVFVVFMAILSILVLIGIDVANFELYAGQDATNLSRMEQDAASHIFYVQRAGTIIISEQTVEKYAESVLATLPIEKDAEYYVVRNSTHDFIVALDNKTFLHQWLEQIFNQEMKIFSNQYETPTKYALYLEDSKINAIALEQKNISDGKSIYYYWPHFVIYTPFASDIQLEMQKIRVAVLAYQRGEELPEGIRAEDGVLYQDRLKLKAIV